MTQALQSGTRQENTGEVKFKNQTRKRTENKKQEEGTQHKKLLRRRKEMKQRQSEANKRKIYAFVLVA